MRGYGNAQRYAQQAAFVASAAIGVRATSDAATQTEALSDVTGGGSDTIADLRAVVDSLDDRVTALEP